MSRKRNELYCLNCGKRVRYEEQHFDDHLMMWTCKRRTKK